VICVGLLYFVNVQGVHKRCFSNNELHSWVTMLKQLWYLMPHQNCYIPAEDLSLCNWPIQYNKWRSFLLHDT